MPVTKRYEHLRGRGIRIRTTKSCYVRHDAFFVRLRGIFSISAYRLIQIHIDHCVSYPPPHWQPHHKAATARCCGPATHCPTIMEMDWVVKTGFHHKLPIVVVPGRHHIACKPRQEILIVVWSSSPKPDEPRRRLLIEFDHCPARHRGVHADTSHFISRLSVSAKAVPAIPACPDLQRRFFDSATLPLADCLTVYPGILLSLPDPLDKSSSPRIKSVCSLKTNTGSIIAEDPP